MVPKNNIKFGSLMFGNMRYCTGLALLWCNVRKVRLGTFLGLNPKMFKLRYSSARSGAVEIRWGYAGYGEILYGFVR